MFLSAIDDVHKLVIFYTGFTCLYFPIILCVLYFTDYLFSTGKYIFFYVIGIISFIECFKYVIGSLYILKRNSATSGRFDERYVSGSAKKNTKNRVKEWMKCFLLIVIMTGVYFVLSILFGAQVFTKYEETFMLSVLLCALTVFPTCLNMGAHSVINLLLGHKPSSDILGMLHLRNIQLTLFGAWLGAFVIPLDWDRPWQEWPIPCSSGAMFGFTAANLVMLSNVMSKVTKKHITKSGRKMR